MEKCCIMYPQLNFALHIVKFFGHSIMHLHYDDVIMGAIASLITSLTIVYFTIYSNADQRKHQSSASPAFVWGIHRGPVNSPHKWPVTRKMFQFDDVIMTTDIYLIAVGVPSNIAYNYNRLNNSKRLIDSTTLVTRVCLTDVRNINNPALQAERLALLSDKINLLYQGHTALCSCTVRCQ